MGAQKYTLFTGNCILAYQVRKVNKNFWKNEEFCLVIAE